jgi:predicted nuclease of restriction endonuclease-like (RecB) superfamily
MSISHALLLASVTKAAERKKLLSEAIANHWSSDVLTDKLRSDREGSIVRPVKTTGEKLVRHRTTVKT